MTQSRAIDLEVTLDQHADLEEFAECIKDAVVTRIRVTEKFSGIRLAGIRMMYNDFQREGIRGRATQDGRIEVRQVKNALQLAGTVVHEMAHQLVGVQESHNENWRDACTALGLIRPSVGQDYMATDFDSAMLHVIEEAILRFAVKHPELIYDPNIEIPLPAHVGLPNCECNGSEHRLHVMQFQLDGVREMLRRRGNILLADEMGLGKTVQAMLYINAIHPKRILIGCPNNAKLVWKRHFTDWCIWPDILEELDVTYSALCSFNDVIISNYEALAKWGDVYKKQEWDLVIYDEGHYLKTPNAKRSRVAYSIGAKKKIIITGTPIVNYPYEIFPLIHYLDRQNWPEVGYFEARYGSRNPDTKLGRNLQELNNRLRATIMTRRFKKDVLAQLPKKRRQIIEFETSPEIRKLIEEEKKLFNSVKSLPGKEESQLVDWVNAMRNESDVAETDFDWEAIIEELKYTRRYAFEEMARIAHKIGLAKLDLACEFIANTLDNREKVIVFGHHRDVLAEVHRRFPGSVLLMGGNANQSLATQQAADRFNNDDNCTVFCGQVTNAQGYSLQGSSTVIFIEEDWVPGIMTQAEDRAHGIGRGDAEAKSMLVYHLVFEDSLDTYKAKLTIRKQKSIDRATGKGTTV